LVGILGGDIKIKSKSGEGSTFFFDLWLPISQQEEQRQNFRTSDNDTNEKPLKGYKILVVEDNEINKLITQKFLTKWGAEFFHAENGQIAIDMVKGNEFSSILMDIEMPVMGGYEATQNIRRINKTTCQSIPIIALTASALPDIQARIKDAGMNDFLIKPFNPKELKKKFFTGSKNKEL